MCMFEQLLKEYEDKLREEDKKNENKRIKTAQYDFYLPKIRDYFIPFIRDFIEKNNVSYMGDEERFFNERFSRDEIILATVFYVENCPQKRKTSDNKKRSISTILDFLNSFNNFFDLVLSVRFRMRHLYYLKPFQDKLIGEIRDKLHEKGIMIVDVTSYPAIQQKEVDFIISFFKNKKKITEAQRQVWILFQMSLLYGISMGTLGDIMVEDIDLERRKLRILNKDRTTNIFLEMPYEMYVLVKKHIDENGLEKGQRFFYTKRKSEKPVQSSIYSYVMKVIVDEYKKKICDDEVVLRRFTQYGMVRYAIIQMLNANVNIAHIVDLTGVDVEFVMNCRDEDMYESKNLSDYLNIKLRMIKTFTAFN